MTLLTFAMLIAAAPGTFAAVGARWRIVAAVAACMGLVAAGGMTVLMCGGSFITPFLPDSDRVRSCLESSSGKEFFRTFLLIAAGLMTAGTIIGAIARRFLP